jgi:hypothetical protein
MICRICLKKYDHSSCKPYQLSCPHTYCLDCVLKIENCPDCGLIVVEKNQNIALLEFIPEFENNSSKTETNEHNQAKTCQICMEKFDHSKYMPYNLCCPHTFCLNCVNKIEKCPVCCKVVTSKYPNLAFLDFVQESEYDVSKKETTLVVNEICETKSNLNNQREAKLNENMNKLESIKETIEKIQISDQSNDVYVSLKANKTKLINEIDHLKMKIKENLELFIVPDSLVVDLSQNKIKLEKDQLTIQELGKLKMRLQVLSRLINGYLKEISEFNESHEFILNGNIDSKKIAIGIFKTTYYNKVIFFKINSL